MTTLAESYQDVITDLRRLARFATYRQDGYTGIHCIALASAIETIRDQRFISGESKCPRLRPTRS